MATVTETISKTAFVRPARTYDYLYDPVFTVSSERDHAKQSFKSHTSVDKIRFVPHFRTMFSSLRHYPRQAVTLDTTDPVPKHMPRQWGGYRDQARETLVRYKKFNYDPDVKVPPKQFEDPKTNSTNQYKYFKRPIIPFLPQMPPNVILAPTRVDPLSRPTGRAQEMLAGPSTRTVMVQTDYRESEAQTDPYSPEYVVRPGSQPELLTLATLSYGAGLPAGLAEVEMIERARAKRAWEATLPPLSDLSQLGKRRKMMEEQERKEWAFREQEIKILQDERLEVLQSMLKQREVDHQALNDKRLEHLWAKKQAAKEKHGRRLRTDHVKALRKLTQKSANVEGRLEKRQVIRDYTKFDSQVYAPMTRIGMYLDTGSEQYSVKSRFTNTMDGLLELEDNLDLSVTTPDIQAPVRSARGVGGTARKTAKLGAILDQVHTQLVTERTKGKESPKPLRFLERIEKPVPRPPTPIVPCPSPGSEEEELAIVLLQRVIRGRAIQTKMYEGKEMRRQLIEELRTTHALQAPEQKIKKTEAADLKSKQSLQKEHLHKECLVEDRVEGPAAALIGTQLDFLNKELIRLQEERRIHAFVLLADRQRRMREAEESGKRQREERLRRTEDEIFKQMMRVHTGSVESYLEDVILASVEKTADDQARQEIQKQAQAINQVAHQYQYSELSGNELVAEMVYSFLLPEVERKTMRQRVKHSQRRHLLAAHKAIYKETEEQLRQLDPTPQAKRQLGQSDPAPQTEEQPKQSNPAQLQADEQPGQSDPTPQAEEQPRQSDPPPQAEEQPGQSDPTPQAKEQPRQSDPPQQAEEQPGQSDPTPQAEEQSGQSDPTPQAEEQTGQEQPGQSDPPQQAEEQPGQSDTPQQAEEQPGQSDTPQQAEEQPGQSDTPQQAEEQPGQSDTPQQAEEQPGQSDPPQQS
ncbi:cilia- and flagella-associated protein 91-like [Halichondria panicea]|uniref:cilia- and flagella-associated protein 91-like n=1 Tax=Halichondria panicea TaxID=6063 RepID=UPI00312B6329